MVINFNPKYIPGDIVYNHKKEIIRITSSYLKGTKLFYYRDGENGWIVLCKWWKPEYHNLFCYLYLHKEEKILWVGSHFTMTEDKKKSTRLATNEERLMLFEKMFKYGIALNKQEHHLIGKLC